MRHLLTFVAALIVGMAVVVGVENVVALLAVQVNRIDRMARADAELSARLDSAEAHTADLARVSHERRALLADELRREMKAEVEKLKRDVAAIAREVALCRMDLGVGFLDDEEAVLRLEHRVGKRLAALEARKPEVVRTEVVREVKVVERPVYVLPAPPPMLLVPVLPRRCR